MEPAYVIFDAYEIHLLDFSQLSVSSASKSSDGTKAFVKWEGPVPSCIESLVTKGPYLNLANISPILLCPDWGSIDIRGL